MTHNPDRILEGIDLTGDSVSVAMAHMARLKTPKSLGTFFSGLLRFEQKSNAQFTQKHSTRNKKAKHDQLENGFGVCPEMPAHFPLMSAHVRPMSAHFPGEHLPNQDNRSFHGFFAQNPKRATKSPGPKKLPNGRPASGSRFIQ